MRIIKTMGVAVCGAAMLTGCYTASGVVEYAITSGNENLQGLTKITDNETQTVHSINVDSKTSTLFLALREGGQIHIYKKENPLSASMHQITSGDVLTYQPCFNSATNSLVFVYCSRYNGTSWAKGDVYTLGLQNVNALKPVTQTPTTEEYCPSFGSEGDIVCYQANQGYSGQIWVKNIKTGETTLLGNGMQPALSPDGKKIVFCRYKSSSANSPSNIWVMNVDGSNVVQLTTSGEEQAFRPSWSPDGKRIVFEANKLGTNSNAKENVDIYVINEDGSGLAQLTTNESYDGHPKWSSDGFIYFVSDRGSKQSNRQVWRFRAYE